MAITTLTSRVRINAGEVRESPMLDLGGFSGFEVRLNPLLADFDDPTVLLTVTARYSTDGGVTWNETIATIVGGARTKDGGLPFVGFANIDSQGNRVPFPAGTLGNMKYTGNTTIRIGFDGETS